MHRKKHECEFSIGDYVRIRKWEDMEQEFGLTEDGDIACQFIFTTSMREIGLEGLEFVISDIDNGGIFGGHKTHFTISGDMIEHVQDTIFDSEEIDSFLNAIHIK